MKGSLGRAFFIAAGIWLAAMGGLSGAEDYQRYCNGRFGFCVDYPARLTMGPPPANNDGVSFADGKGLRLTASGSNNVTEATLQSEWFYQERQFDWISYRTGGSDWYVLSGYKGETILYLKTFVGRGSINHLRISYPAGRKVEYDGMVSRVSRSFRPGGLDEEH